MFPSVLPQPRRHAAADIPVLRWGIVGPGWIAERFVQSLNTQSQQRVLAVASRTLAKAERFATQWGIPHACGDIDALLARGDIDAVYIATPHNHHFPDGLRALNAGKHVLIEKPLALNAQQGQALYAAAAAQGKLVMEAMWCDYAPKYDVIRQLLADGVLGEVHTLLADHGEFFTPDHRIYNPDLAGGPMLDLGSYLVSLSVMVGGAPETIVARGTPAPGGRVNGQTSMLFTQGPSLHSVLHTTLMSNTPGGAIVAGNQATLNLEGQFYAPGNFTLTASSGGNVLHWEEPRNRYDQLFHQAEHFAWCVGQGLADSPRRSSSQVIATLAAMDEVRRQIGVVFNEEQ
ncbi:oxidoreductase [Enterobacterales bacterium CwR94]|nr:oxidoreductase [Enterobacterales bacterium CwR94]